LAQLKGYEHINIRQFVSAEPKGDFEN